MIDEKSIIVFSLHGEDEHIGQLVDDGSTTGIMVINEPRSVLKQMTPDGSMQVGLGSFVLNMAELKTVNISLKSITWYSMDVGKNMRNAYISSLTNLVVANQMPKGNPGGLKLVK